MREKIKIIINKIKLYHIYIRLQIKVWSNTKLLFQLKKGVQLVGTLKVSVIVAHPLWFATCSL